MLDQRDILPTMSRMASGSNTGLVRLKALDPVTFSLGREPFVRALQTSTIIKSARIEAIMHAQNVLEIAKTAVDNIFLNSRLVLISSGFTIPTPEFDFITLPKDRKFYARSYLNFPDKKNIVQFDYGEMFEVLGPHIGPKSEIIAFKEPFRIGLTTRTNPMYAHANLGRGNEGLLVVGNSAMIKQPNELEGPRALASFVINSLTRRVEFEYPDFKGSLIPTESAVMAELVEHNTTVYLTYKAQEV